MFHDVAEAGRRGWTFVDPSSAFRYPRLRSFSSPFFNLSFICNALISLPMDVRFIIGINLMLCLGNKNASHLIPSRSGWECNHYFLSSCGRRQAIFLNSPFDMHVHHCAEKLNFKFAKRLYLLIYNSNQEGRDAELGGSERKSSLP